ncbi:unnamed protein product [Caenorhabditis bovis]|uniref:Uncharacterized protein n=1 Tax=Caenorhabditis bovis TaxID=2654633 RepID=A0A8S1FBW2_9PELO|nr:unnamed protein product [Caenorhabditis bovis]
MTGNKRSSAGLDDLSKTTMYRSEVCSKILNNPNLIDKFVLIILPNYFYDYEAVQSDLISHKFGIIAKDVKNLKSKDIMAWKSAELESQDIWEFADKLADGPSMIFLCQRANAFEGIAEIASFHNEIAQRTNHADALYFSKNTLAAYQDIHFFFPKYANEKEVIEHAKNYLSSEVWPKLSEGLARVAVERPDNPIKWLANYLESIR